MAGEYFTCPFCRASVPITQDTYRQKNLSFDSLGAHGLSKCDTCAIGVKFLYCPGCEQVKIEVVGYSDDLEGFSTSVFPPYEYIAFPEYIPLQIRQDYEEACAIKDLSPKAAATLARRCLQGMIRDFWSISEENLSGAIRAIKDKIDPGLWEVIDGVRRIGNIGAHMESDVNLIVDIEPSEASALIKLIEHLMKEWYIARQTRLDLFSSIKQADEKTQQQRKPTST